MTLFFSKSSSSSFVFSALGLVYATLIVESSASYCVMSGCGCDLDRYSWCTSNHRYPSNDPSNWCGANQANCLQCSAEWCTTTAATATNPVASGPTSCASCGEYRNGASVLDMAFCQKQEGTRMLCYPLNQGTCPSDMFMCAVAVSTPEPTPTPTLDSRSPAPVATPSPTPSPTPVTAAAVVPTVTAVPSAAPCPPFATYNPAATSALDRCRCGGGHSAPQVMLYSSDNCQDTSTGVVQLDHNDHLCQNLPPNNLWINDRVYSVRGTPGTVVSLHMHCDANSQVMHRLVLDDGCINLNGYENVISYVTFEDFTQCHDPNATPEPTPTPTPTPTSTVEASPSPLPIEPMPITPASSPTPSSTVVPTGTCEPLPHCAGTTSCHQGFSSGRTCDRCSPGYELSDSWETINLTSSWTNTSVPPASAPFSVVRLPAPVPMSSAGPLAIKINPQGQSRVSRACNDQAVTQLHPVDFVTLGVTQQPMCSECEDVVEAGVGTVASGVWTNIALTRDLGNHPMVFAYTQTSNNNRYSPIRMTSSGSDDLIKLRIQADELTGNDNAVPETVGWLAVRSDCSTSTFSSDASARCGVRTVDGDTGTLKTGHVVLDGLEYKYELGLMYAIDSPNTYQFQTSFGSTPTVLASIQSFSGADPSHVAMLSVSPTHFSFAVDEDDCRDGRDHPMREWVAILALERTDPLGNVCLPDPTVEASPTPSVLPAPTASATPLTQSVYVLGSGPRDFNEARMYCRSVGGSLVVIDDAQENAVVQGVCGARSCWIGLSEDAGTETWFWEDRTPLAGGYTNWHASEPNNWDGVDESVAIMNLVHPQWGSRVHGEWYDAHINNDFPYPLCEIAAGTQVTSSPTVSTTAAASTSAVVTSSPSSSAQTSVSTSADTTASSSAQVSTSTSADVTLTASSSAQVSTSTSADVTLTASSSAQASASTSAVVTASSSAQVSSSPTADSSASSSALVSTSTSADVTASSSAQLSASTSADATLTASASAQSSASKSAATTVLASPSMQPSPSNSVATPTPTPDPLASVPQCASELTITTASYTASITLLAPFAVDAPLQDAQVRTAITGAIGLLSCANTAVVTSSTTAQKADTAIAVQVEVTDADESRLQYMQDAAMLKAAINQGLNGNQQITAVQGVSWAVAPGPDPSPAPDTAIDPSSSTSEDSETQGSGQSEDDSSTTMGVGVAAGGAGLVALVFVANNMRKKQKLRVKPTALKMARTSAISSTSDGLDRMRRSSSGKGSFGRRRPSVQAYPVDTMHMLRDDDGTRRSLTGKLSDMEAGDDQGAARQMSFMSDSDHSDMAMDDILVPEHQPPELSHIMTGPSMRSLGRTLQMVPAAPEESYDTWATSEAPVPAGVPDLEFMAAPARVPDTNPRKKVQLPKVKNFTLALAPSVEKAVADQTNKVFAELDQEVDGYILDRALASYLHISPAEAAHIITEAKIALHGRRDNGKLTRDEFSAVLRLAADHYLDRDSFTPLQEMPQRAVRHYRRIFEDLDEKGRGVITLQQLAMGMPGMDDVVGGLASSRGSQGILTFEQFANVLHRAERGGAGRAMAQLLEETPEGRALINAVRSQQETTDTASAAQPVDPTTVPPLVMDMWVSANPDPRTGVADVDQLRDALVMANNSGDLMCTEQELVHLVGTLSLRSESGQVDFDGFWRTLEPLVEVVQEGLAISQSGMQSSIMASSIMSSNDYMPGYHGDDLYCQDVFSSLVGRVDIEHARIGSRDLMSKIHNVLNSAKMGTDRVFYFHLTNLVSTAPLDDLDYRMFASLVKDAETATMVDVDDEWDPADAMRLLM